jgi:hypothetical protein
VEFTGAAENNMQPGGTKQELLGVDAVGEFNVLIDSYSAGYGKRPAAQVSHQHSDHFAADPVRAEAALVKGIGTLRPRPTSTPN